MEALIVNWEGRRHEAMRADARAKREQLIAAATELFRTLPNSDVTLDAIAKRAGVGIATLYRHFPTREDLRIACALNLFDTLDAVLTDVVERFDDAPESTWEDAIWRLADFGIGVIVEALSDAHPHTLRPEVRAEVHAKRVAFFDHVQLLLDKAAAHGLVDPHLAPLEVAAELIVVTRPLTAVADEVFPDVKDRLVGHLLTAWRVSARENSSAG